MRKIVILSALVVAGLAVPALSAGKPDGSNAPDKPERKQPRVIDLAPMLPERAQNGIGKAVDAIDEGGPDSNG